ncbi:MAG: sodium-dependent transporter [Bdellovibrionaceae bacterium]|nr:sodium-dependent transporter [Pseudobdellovibrionaceae bacterium]MBX3035128.1 sodium-dependent transporter [Pseudobdellovibrionaceae bacterium]
MTPIRGSWRTRFGFYLVAIGSACGLGNLWRFPYVVGENGGGAFVLLYALMALILGAPLLIGELILGKTTRQSVMMATRELEKRSSLPFRWAGRFALLMSLVVLSYYSVIAGWVLHFIVQFMLGLFSTKEEVTGGLSVLMGNGGLQWALASVHILITLIVVAKGVQEGLERWISAVMPLFAVLVCLLIIRTMSLPSAPDVLRFLFYPDFSKLTFASLNHAIGHVLFTLSVGFGTMVTFGSYMREQDHAPTAGFRVAMVDTVVSLAIGLLVFPVAFQASNVPLTDPGLMFEVLPKFLLQIPGGLFFGLIFFVSLYLAALNASVGLFETIVANVKTSRGRNRDRSTAAWQSGALILGLSLFPALSSTAFRRLEWNNHGLIESIDSLLINWLLPVAALGLMFAIYRGMGEKALRSAFLDQDRLVSQSMYPHWIFLIKWVIPGLIALGLFLQVLGLLKLAP